MPDEKDAPQAIGPDFKFATYGTLVGITPVSERAANWIKESVELDGCNKDFELGGDIGEVLGDDEPMKMIARDMLEFGFMGVMEG